MFQLLRKINNLSYLTDKKPKYNDRSIKEDKAFIKDIVQDYSKISSSIIDKLKLSA